MANDRKLDKKFEINLNTRRKIQPSSKLLTNIPYDVFRGKLIPLLNDAKDIINLSYSCFDLYRYSEEDINKRTLKQLLQAIVEDDQAKAKNILLHASTKRLLFLLTKDPVTLGIKEIVFNSPDKSLSLRFKTKKVFIFAQMLKRTEMIRLILPYFDKLKEHTFEKVAQWKMPKPLNASQQKTMQDYYIEKFFLPLIFKFAADTTIDVKCHTNNEVKLYKEGQVLSLNASTVSAIDEFKKNLLPQTAIDFDKIDHPLNLNPDNYVDIEEFLAAACQAYVTHINQFQNQHQRNAYSICIVGFIISLLGTEDQNSFWHWLDYFTHNMLTQYICESGSYAAIVTITLARIKTNIFNEFIEEICPPQKNSSIHCCVIS